MFGHQAPSQFMNGLDMSAEGKRLSFPVSGMGSGVVDITAELKASE